MSKSIPRPEFPNPQAQRADWLNLNGEWEFEFDHAVSGLEKNYVSSEHFSKVINVPYSYEAPLSGINEKDFCECVWYRKEIEIGTDWSKGKLVLHFGACDFYTEVYINGAKAGFHRGGQSPFAIDITKYTHEGKNVITVRVVDKIREGNQPGGKQCPQYQPFACLYTRTTGIWQTVWIEHIDCGIYVDSYKVVTDIEAGTATFNVTLSAAAKNAVLTADVAFEGRAVAKSEIKLSTRYAAFTVNIPKNDLHLWDLGEGNLYDVTFTLKADSGCDVLSSYFGMRSVALIDNCLVLNGKKVFQRLVLDQGFYAEGTWTAPNDEALKNDIILSMEAGFNGARLHEKVFEPRLLYWADKLGYMVWGEYSNWGINDSSTAYENLIFDWMESVKRDFNHPSIIGWCPFNETAKEQHNDTVALIVELTRAYDPTRPIIDSSGYWHVNTDIFDVHDYEQRPEEFKAHYDPMLTVTEQDDEAVRKEKVYSNDKYFGGVYGFDYTTLPYFVSEYGGIWWNARTEDEASWGYGDRPEDLEEFYTRLEGLTDALLENKRICAFCYTQLTDVEQEQNGIYYYDRSPKFDAARLKAIFSKKAAIEL